MIHNQLRGEPVSRVACEYNSPSKSRTHDLARVNKQGVFPHVIDLRPGTPPANQNMRINMKYLTAILLTHAVTLYPA